jgi:hypothetical protein
MRAAAAILLAAAAFLAAALTGVVGAGSPPQPARAIELPRYAASR